MKTKETEKYFMKRAAGALVDQLFKIAQQEHPEWDNDQLYEYAKGALSEFSMKIKQKCYTCSKEYYNELLVLPEDHTREDMLNEIKYGYMAGTWDDYTDEELVELEDDILAMFTYAGELTEAE